MTGSAGRNREVVLLPNLLTTGNLLCGFAALVLAARGHLAAGAALVFLGMAFDILDGQVARWIGIATDFGVEYDSLADVVTFGVAPAFLMVMHVLAPFGRWAWVSGFLFVVGAALRLARFNVRLSTASGAYFQGLPTPAAAGTVAGVVWLLADQSPGPFVRLGMLVLLPVLALLMVSNLPYRHFKRGYRGVRSRSWLIVAFAGLLALVVVEPRWTLPVLFGGYALSGPLVALAQRWRSRRGISSAADRPSDARPGPAPPDPEESV